MPINLRALSTALLLAGIISFPVVAAVGPDNSTEILLSGAKKWVAKDRADLAKNLLKKLLLIEPNSQEALLMLGKIELKNGNRDEAQRYLTRLEQTASDSPHTQELSDAYHHKTSAHSEPTQPRDRKTIAMPGDDQKTPDQKSVVVKHKSARKSTPQVTAKAQADEGAGGAGDNLALSPDIVARTDALDALADGNVDVAETSLLEIIKRRPHDPEVLGGLGLVNQKRGKFIDAENWFEQALKAAKEGKTETGRWESLIETAQFSQYMTNAKTLLDENKLPQAEAAIQQARTLKPQDPDALAVLGNIKAAANENVEAEQLYRESLKIEGYNVFATRGLASLLARTHRSAQALELIEQVLQDYQSEWKKIPYSQASLLREEANLFIETNSPSRAMNALEKAVKVDPKNPWVRFSLAKLYISLDLAPLGRQVMQEGVALAPKDPVMHYTQALVLLGQDDYAAGLSSLNQIPEEELTEDMRDTRKRALIKYDFQQAENKFAQGNRKEAIRIMSIAQIQARNNYSATEQVAEGWFSLDQQKQGLSAMRALPQPAPLETQVHFASLLNRAKKDQELTDYLPSLRVPEGADDTSKGYRATIQDIEFAMAGRQFDRLIKAGKTDQAQQFADNILNANHLSSSDYFKFHRSYFSSAKLPDNAIAQLNQEKEQNPDDLSIRWELAYAYYQDKQNNNAQREVQELLGLTKSDDIDMRLRIARLQQNLGDNSAARKTLDDLTSRFPNNTQVLLQAGNITQSDGEYNQAMRYYERIREQTQQPASSASAVKLAEQSTRPDLLLNLLPAKSLTGESVITNSIAPPLLSTRESDTIYRSALAGDSGHEMHVTSSDASSAQQAMDSIESRRSTSIEAGLDIQTKPASSGTSTYNATEIPLLARFPIGYEAQGMVQVDQVNIDAGALPSSFADAALFGKIQAAQYVPPQPLVTKASGTSIALGYEQGSVKADIGEVGIGFPISNVVGGIRQGGSIGRMSYSLNLSRRPYTGTLLSYAGARDPVTGATWGGVTNTGISLYMSTTLSTSSLGDLNLSGVASYGLLRGTNVLNNDRLYLRSVIDRDIYKTDNTVFNLGVSLDYMGFSKNQSNFTFGQGGYYSPQNSLTLGVPVELAGRADMLSYQLKAHMSYSHTNTDASTFYPTDPVLQARGAAGAMPAGYTQPIYDASSSSGFGYGLLAATEYRATPNFVLGGRFSMDRSAYYSPNSAFFYVRYLFKPETGQVKMRPDPVLPYSQY
jgi:Flp pilus assembly protein TadD